MNKRFEKYFEGYAVPERIKKIAILIMLRFSISGECDGIYICNRIGVDGRIGDGNGKFCSDTIPEKYLSLVANTLQSAYSSNISKHDIYELKEILANADINEIQAFIGIKNFILACREESKSCEDWRKSYLSSCIGKSILNIATIIEYNLKNKTRLIKFTAGLTGEFDIIKTNAPDDVIREHMKNKMQKEKEGISITNFFEKIEEKGYFVTCLTDSSSSLCDDNHDFVDLFCVNFDYYDCEE